MIRYQFWTDNVESTKPGDTVRSWTPGTRHAALVIHVPPFVVKVLRRFLQREDALAPRAWFR